MIIGVGRGGEGEGGEGEKGPMLLVAFVAVGANSGKGKEKVTSTIVPKVRLVGSSHSIERTFGGACLVSIENSMLPQTFAGNDQFWGGPQWIGGALLQGRHGRAAGVFGEAATKFIRVTSLRFAR